MDAGKKNIYHNKLLEIYMFHLFIFPQISSKEKEKKNHYFFSEKYSASIRCDILLISAIYQQKQFCTKNKTLRVIIQEKGSNHSIKSQKKGKKKKES